MRQLVRFLCLFSIVILSCKSIKTDNFVANDFFAIGNDYLTIDNYPRAIEFYLKSLDYNFNDKVLINLIIAYQKNKEYLKAEEIIIKNYDKAKKDVALARRYLKLLGNNYFYMNNLSMAVKTYTLFVESYKDDAEAYFNLGVCHYLSGNRESGLKAFIQSTEVDPKFLPSLRNVADYYYLEGKKEEALKYYNSLKSVDTQNPEVFYRLSLLTFAQNEYEVALENINKAISLNSKENDYFITAARILIKGYSDSKKALEMLTKAFENGYKEFITLSTLSEFNIFAEQKEFKALVEKYKKP